MPPGNRHVVEAQLAINKAPAMITNFESHTAPLTEEELSLAAIVLKNMRKYTKEKPIKEPQIVAGMKASGHKFSGVILRKLINHLRGTAQAPIIATSRGYYWDEDVAEITAQIKSMRDRISAIAYGADGLERYLQAKVRPKLNPRDPEPELFDNK